MSHNSSVRSVLNFTWLSAILVFSIVIGQLFAIVMFMIPSAMRISRDVPVNPLTLVTVSVSIVMILKLSI